LARGCGLAIRSRRQQQMPEPLTVIACTRAYMAPEQTGRKNQSI
jgi:hypothetical protein